MKLRLLLKNIMCRIGIGDWLIEYCDECGRRQPLVWWCDSQEVYFKVTGDRLGSPCPECFNRIAHERGFFLRWYAVDESARARGEAKNETSQK
jgi:hypothetical protein